MAKTMNVNLVFNANTQQVKAQLEQLRSTLNNLTNTSFLTKGTGNKFTQDIKTATSSVSQLKAILNTATDEAGKLNLGHFTQSMQQAGLTLPKLKQDLMSMGAEGQKAFMQLTRSIANSTVGVSKSTMMVDKLWGSLKNVATWQVSSKLLYGFMNQISNAYNYTQDLNESLNNIRIVTGYSTDEMSKFAEQANKAAKALSASTLEYTDAALIYYQQGLSGKEVTQRADATIKLANVARTSGEQASEWMTAIWNNFDNGSKSLEYYADVLTKLGADTASSADEIAGGLEKFSAVANTVGLSYEYAAAALATITAQTRQSEDVVGTSLKTLFARIENLSLGDTLDDGTTLNQYSEALYKVGINVKDASGQLKDMDTILNEMGATWGTLSKDQQIALAQTVGGIRQYNQLIALMDNWDFFEKNVDSARNATGELNKQNEIYAESWEAANKRVKASAEGLYQTLLDDKFFIEITDGFGSLLSEADNFIESVGGLKTVLPGLIALFGTLFGDKIIGAATSLSGRFKEASNAAMQANMEMKQMAISQTLDMQSNSMTAVDTASVDVASKVLKIQEQTLGAKRALTEAEKRHAQALVQTVEESGKIYKNAAKTVDATQQEVNNLQDQKKHYLEMVAAMGQAKDPKGYAVGYGSQLASASNLDDFIAKATGADEVSDNLIQSLTELWNAFSQMKNIAASSSNIETFIQKVKAAGLDGGRSEEELRELYNTIQNFKDVKFGDITSGLKKAKTNAKGAKEALKEAEEGFNKTAEAAEKANGKLGNMNFSSVLMKGATAASSLAMSMNALKSIVDIWSSEDATLWDQISTTMMSLSMLMPGLIMSWKAFGFVFKENYADTIRNTYATRANAKAKAQQAMATDIADKEMQQQNTTLDINTTKSFTNAKGTKYYQQNGQWYYTNKNGKAFKTSQARAMNQLNAAGTTRVESMSPAPRLGSKLGTGLKNAGANVAAAAPYLVAAAAVALMVVSIKAGIDNYNKLSKAAEQANKTANKLRTTAQETREAYNNMLQTSNEYIEGYKGLEKLTQGTQEYKKALLETNAKARELINTYEDLQYTIDEQGAIKIDEDSLIEAQNKEFQDAVAADAAATSAAQRARELDNEVAIQKILRKNNYNQLDAQDSGALGWGAGAGASAGIAAGIIAGMLSSNPLGWALGATLLVGGLTSGLLSDGATSAEYDAIEELKKKYSTTGAASTLTANDIQKTLEGKYDQELINALKEDTAAIQELIKTNAENNELTLKENQLMVKERMQADGTYDDYDPKTADYIAKIGGAGLEQREAAIRKEMKGWGTDGISKATGVNQAAKDVAKEYLEAIGDTSLKLSDTTGTDGNRQFVFLDEKGQKVTKTLEEMKEAVINHKALNQTADNTKQIAANVANMRATNEGTALLEMVSSKSLTNVASGLVTGDLASKFATKESTANFLDQYLDDGNKDGISDATAQLYGYDTADKMYEAMIAMRDAAARALDAIDDDMHDIERYSYNNLSGKSKLSESQLKAFKEENREAYNILGQEGTSLFTSLYNSVGTEDKDSFMAVVGDIDWATISIAEATIKARDVVDTSSPAWEQYAQKMHDAANATLSASESFEKLRKEIVEINSIIKDLEIGEVISDEEYQKIIEKNAALTDSFAKVAEGWRVITDPQDIKTNIYDAINEDFDKAFAKAQKYEEYADKTFKKYDKEIKDNAEKFESDYGLIYSDHNNTVNDQNTADVQYEALKRIGAIQAGGKYDDSMEPLLARAGLDKKTYEDMIRNIIKGDEASSADLENMQKLYDAAGDIYREYSTEAFSKENVLSTYTDLKDSLLEVNKVLIENSDNVEDNSKAYDNYIAKKKSELDISEEESKLLRGQVKNLNSVSKELKNNAQWVDLVATENAELNTGLIDLVENQDKYLEALATSDWDTIAEMANSVSQIIGGFTDDEDPYSFISQNMDLINELLKGNYTVVDDLQQRLAQTRLEALNLTGEAAIAMQNMLANTDFNMEIGATLEGAAEVRAQLMAIYNDAERVDSIINNVFGGTFQLNKNTGQYHKIRGSNLINVNAINKAKKGSEKKADEFDPKRYHEIDEILDDIGRKLDIIKEKRDRAFGNDKLKYFTQELQIMNQDLEATEEKLRQANEHYATDRNAILKYGVQLDEAGRITNYDEVRQRYYQQYASNPEAYADAWDKVNEELDQYEETLNLTEELEQEKLDKWYAIQDLKLENIEYEVTFNIEASEDTMKYLDLILKELDNDAYDAAKAIETLGEKTITTTKDIEAYRKGINDILKGADFTDEEIQKFFNGDGSVFDGKTLTQDQVDKLREYRDNLIESTDALKEYRDQVYEIALNAFTAWNKKFDENADKIERANKLLETHQNLIEITGKKYLGVDNELLESISKSRVALSQSNLQNSVANFEANKQALEKAQADLKQMENNGASKESLEKQKELIKEIEQTTVDSEQEMMDNLVATMELAGEVFEDTVDRVMETLNEALGNITELQEQFDKQRKIEELYLADHKKLYEINKLNRDIQKSIDQTDNVKAQRELAEIAEEVMSYQSEGANMSKYDLGYLQKRYDLKKAEIALEEAQNAKNQVKLQRDSKGNWGYVYTADQSNIDKAQGDYDKALYEVQEFSYQSERELTEKYLSLQQEMMDEIKKLRISDFASREEYLAKVAEIQNHYTQLSNATLMEIEDLTYQNGIINRDYATEMADTYYETLIGRMYPSYQNFEELSTGISDSLQDTLTSLGDAYTTWSSTVNTAMTTAKIGPEQFVNYMTNTYIPKMQEAADKTSQNVQQIRNDMIRNLLGENGEGGAIGAVSQFISNFETEMGKVDGVANSVSDAMQNISNAASGAMDQLSRDLSNMRDMIDEMYQLAATGSEIAANPIPSSKNDNLNNVYDDAVKIDRSTYVQKNGKWYKASGAVQSITNDEGKITGVSAANVDTSQSYNLIRDDTSKTKGRASGYGFSLSSNSLQQELTTPTQTALNEGYREVTSYTIANDGTLYLALGRQRYYSRGQLDTKTSIIDGKVYAKPLEGAQYVSSVNDSYQLQFYKGQEVKVVNGTTTGTISQVHNGLFGPMYSVSGYSPNNSYANASPGSQFEDISTKGFPIHLLPKFDTGGYTGSWGADGRLAMLHQKEIVLNSHDTENFLAAVKIVRSMSDMLEQNAAIASRGLQIEKWMTNVLGQRQSIDQNVKIEAHFPNVTDRYEIEQAFNSLINDASQYANRK